MMAVRIRRVSTVIAVLAVAAFLVPVGNASVRADAPTANPTLYVKYAMDCTFHIEDDAGRRVTSIAPGSYQLEVSTPLMFKLVRPGGVGVDVIAPNDFTGCKGWVQFQLTGPGVDVFTTLDWGCDAFLTMGPETFKAGATYTAQDMNQPSVTRTALTVLSAGSPTIPNTPYSTTSGKGETFASQVGKNIKEALGVKVAGTLNGGVSTLGKLTLTRQGKTVSTLKPGRYRITVLDETSTKGFAIQKLGQQSPVKVTGATFVGRHSKIVTLKVGDWVYSSGLGKGHSFRVTD